MSNVLVMTLFLTRPRFTIGSSDMLFGLGHGSLAMSMASWNWILRSHDTVGAIVMGRVRIEAML